MSNETANKQKDLQCLRGFAILIVLLFHVWPRLFPNGYLGVDIFFVLSGYFMASTTLRNGSGIDFMQICQFYFKRIRRIAPLYLINIIAVLALTQIFVFPGDTLRLVGDVRWALAFASNVGMSREPSGYFALTSRNMFLLHYWSLGVEMQFYVIVPFLLAATRLVRSHAIKLLLCIIALSKGYELHQSGERATFGFLEGRVWQFAVGIGAYVVQQPKSTNKVVTLRAQEYSTKPLIKNGTLLTNNDKNQNNVNDPLKLKLPGRLCVVSVCALCALTCSRALSREVARDVTTVISGLVIYLCGLTPTQTSYFLSVPLAALAYLGDISYSLYLIHWPVVVLVRYWTFDVLDLKSGMVAVFLSILLAIQMHHCLEKPLTKPSRGVLFTANVLLITYTLIALALYFKAELDPTKKPLSPFVRRLWLEDKTLINDGKRWDEIAKAVTSDRLMEMITLTAGYKCRFLPRSRHPAIRSLQPAFSTDIYGNGSLSVLIIGNSHGQCLTPVIARLLAGKYDVILNAPVGRPPERDANVRNLQESLDVYSKYCKYIIISGKNVQFGAYKDLAGDIGRHIFQTRSLAEFQFPEKEARHAAVNAQLKYNAISCKKCTWMDFITPFCRNGTCSAFDEATQIPLFWDFNHVTPFGAEKLAPVIATALKRVGL